MVWMYKLRSKKERNRNQQGSAQFLSTSESWHHLISVVLIVVGLAFLLKVYFLRVEEHEVDKTLVMYCLALISYIMLFGEYLKFSGIINQN